MSRDRLHVNPLRPRIVMVANKESGEMVEKEEPMSYRDAALISLILTVWQMFVSFLTLFTWQDISADPYTFLYKFVCFMGGTFFGFFIILSGLSRWTQNTRSTS